MYTKTLSTVSENDVQLAGQRAVDLAQIPHQKIAVPQSFVVLSTALDAVIASNNLKPKLDFLMGHLDKHDSRSVMNLYTSIRRQLSSAKLPEELVKELQDMYDSIAAQGIGLESGTQPLRVILSTNAPENPESNDTVIQNVQDWDEFLVAVREVWALAWLPSQFNYRTEYTYNERNLSISILVQVMQAAEVSVHAHSAMPEDDSKVYLEVYEGYTDLREKVAKSFYAVTKDQLELVLSELHEQPHKLAMHKRDLVLEDIPSKQLDDILIRRQIEELGRLTKKVERTLDSPVKCFFAVNGVQKILLWVNRLPLSMKSETPVETPQTVEVVELEEPADDVVISADDTRSLNDALEGKTPEAEFASAGHSAEKAIMDAVEEVVEETTGDEFEGNAKLLAASLRRAFNVIEMKYDKLFGQVGDDFHEMLQQLNVENAFPRPVDESLLRIAHNMVHHSLEVNDDDYKRMVSEITFILEN